ncbi:shikimate transporter [Escherichia coli]|uniref:Shikimate transporter n=1 Tax=Escherichia coli TaxID=562 RepID=A0A485JGR8_ECOLX|nr:shikimate transporter [Escherichia coli]
MLMLTVWMMGIATALIGILPSFSTIGWWAPILLVTLRAIQGFAVGGEWGGAALLSVESAPKIKKPFTVAVYKLLRSRFTAFDRTGFIDQYDDD